MKKKRISKFYNAMRKYGPENFDMSVIEKVDDELLDEREMFWISKLDTLKNGYNSTLGGSGIKRCDYKLIQQLWRTGMSTLEICKITHASKATVTHALYSEPTYSWRESKLRGLKNQKVKICQYELSRKFVATYDSIQDACKKYNVDNSALINACRGRSNTCAGFQWRYASMFPPGENIVPYYKKRSSKWSVPIAQYDKDGNLICIYQSPSDASNRTGVNAHLIRACLCGKQATTGGFIWKTHGEIKEITNVGG